MRTTTLEEVLEEIIDHRGRTPKKLGADFTNAGVPVISAKLIRQGAIDFENVRFVSHETWEKWMPLPLQEGDVILTSEAPLGKTAFVPSNDPLVLGQRLFALRGKADVIDNAYLRYWLDSEVGQAQLAGRASGTTVLGIRQALLRKVEIDLPPLKAQRSVGKFLKALDDKITTNSRIINLSGALVEALYSQVAKKPTAQSFDEIAEVFGGSTPSTKNDAFWDGDINWATPTDITALDGPWIGDTSRKVTEAGLASMSSSLHPENSILLTSRATIGAIALASGPIATNQGFIVVEAPDELTPWLFAQMKARKREFEAWANGATFMELSRGNFKKLPFIGCSDDYLQAFNEAAWPLLKRAQAAQKENQVLARTRDELLPLLMSGRITVGEAENVAGTAASES